jgi:transposase
LRLLAEQKAIPIDQLVRFLGMSRGRVEDLLGELVRMRLVRVDCLLAGEAPWVWLRSAGAVLSGTGFRASTPGRPGLFHLRQINEARLTVEAGSDELEWVSERFLRREKGRRFKGFLPDGAVRTATEVHAIEVELTRKTSSELEHKISAIEAEYDLVVYFATAAVCRWFRQLGLEDRHPRLVLREITKASSALTRPDWRVAGDPPPGGGPRRPALEPSEFDVSVLRLVAEQGAVPMDQLAEFLDLSDAEVEGLVWTYLRAGLVRRARPIPAEPAWVWLARRGMAAAGWRLSIASPRVGGLQMLRAVNEVRLLVAGSPGVRWVGSRQLRRELGRKGSLPKALVELGEERHAIDVWLSSPAERSSMVERLRSREADHDVVVWFYSGRAASAVEQFAESCGSAKLVVRPLPAVDEGRLRRAAWGPRQTGSRRESSSADRLWARLADAEPSLMYRVYPASVPAEALRAAAGAAGVGAVEIVGEAWRRTGKGCSIYRLETEAGVFRVVRSGWGWRADVVRDESVFEFLPDPPREPGKVKPSVKRPYVPARPRRLEFGEEVWAKVRPLIPPIEDRPRFKGGRASLPDRQILSGLVWMVRTGTPFNRVAREGEYGSSVALRSRLRYWEELGVWRSVREALTRLLPDGEELSWGFLAPRGSPEVSGRVGG